MSFMKKGCRAANRKVIKDINIKVKEYSRKFEYYGEIAHKVSLLYSDINETTLDLALTKLGHSDLLKDDMAKFLILGQVHRNYAEKNNETEHTEPDRG